MDLKHQNLRGNLLKLIKNGHIILIISTVRQMDADMRPWPVTALNRDEWENGREVFVQQ